MGAKLLDPINDPSVDKRGKVKWIYDQLCNSKVAENEIPEIMYEAIPKVLKFYEEWELFDEIPTTTTDKHGNVKEEMKRVPRAIPTIGTLAKALNVSRFVLYRWMHKHQVFRKLIESYNGLAKEALMEGGLTGVYQAATAIFLLKSMHGLREWDKDKPQAPQITGKNVQVNFSNLIQGQEQKKIYK